MGIIGEELRSAREQKGLSLLDVEEVTKIRVKYLEAIENEEFDIIPGKVYIKGFLKNYSEFLDLNSSVMLEYLNQLSREKDTDIKVESYDLTPTLVNNNSFLNQKSFLILTAILGVILLLSIYSKLSGNDENKLNEANNLSKSSASKYTDSDSSKEDNKNRESKEKIDNKVNPKNSQEITNVSKKEVIIDQALVKPNINSKVNLVLLATRESSWALVKVDGVQKFIGTIKKNQEISFGGQNNIYIRLGNAGAVDIMYNGKKIEPIGPLHKVSKRTFTTSGIK